MRPIDAGELLDEICREQCERKFKDCDGMCEMAAVVVNAPTIDAVDVVRCKDCRYGQYCTDGQTTYQCFKWNSNEFGALHEQDWFCADGKR